MPLDDSATFAALTLLALLQGLTEFLPVSSSGHLVLAQRAMGLEEPTLVVDVALHVGTLAAVLVVYRRDLVELVRELLGGKPRRVLLLALGSLPAAAVGLGLRHVFEPAFESARLAAWGLVATAGILTAGEVARRRGPVRPRAPGWLDALVVGTAQALAIWPGISRSGSTIAAGLLRGLEPREAARFSFLLSIPAILGAAVLELPKVGSVSGSLVVTLLWASAFAGFVGWGALRLLLAFLGRGAFSWFAVYCATLAVGVLAFV